MINTNVTRKSVFRHLYFQVLLAIVIGAFLGYAMPEWGVELKFLGEAFVRLIKMVVAPIIFTTVVVGMAGLGSMKQVGRIGLKSFIYFEVMTTLALIIGLIVVNVFQPGTGFNADPSKLDTKAIQNYITAAKPHGGADFVMNIIPESIIGAFAQGDIIQVLFFSILFGLALAALGEANRPIVLLLDQISAALMKMVGMIVKLAPAAAFGAIAYTTAKFGVVSWISLGRLMACVYLTCACFVFIVLGFILKFNGVSIWKFIKYIKEELFIVLGTASSESVFPRMMQKMEHVGCSKPLVRMVLPGGYSFNLDGSCIYLTAGAIFIAQATNTPLTLTQQITLLVVCLITSKGAAGVVGSAFITLAATIQSFHMLPIEGMVLLLGVDRLMAEARALTNLVGNGVATIVISNWEGGFDKQRADEVLNSPDPISFEALPVTASTVETPIKDKVLES